MDETRCRSGRHVIKSSQDLKNGGCKRCESEAQRLRMQRLKDDAAAFRYLMSRSMAKPSLAQQLTELADQHNLSELTARLRELSK